MQDRYAGDIGDYIKLSLLRRFAAHRNVGVAWWLTPNESHNEDGRFTTFLSKPDRWRHLDPVVFDALTTVFTVFANERSVAALQRCNLLRNASFAAQLLDVRLCPKRERAVHRADWFQSVQSAVSACDFVFVDPDNGIASENHDLCAPTSGKSITMSEIQALAADERTVLIYHHHTRRAGGHLAEIHHVIGRLSKCSGLVPAGALRARPWSPRSFFLVNASEQDLLAIEDFALDWQDHCVWHQAMSKREGEPAL